MATAAAKVDRPVCEICLECYLSDKVDRQSRFLQCGHTFCLGCLQGMLRTTTNNSLTCPNCRAVFTVDSNALAALPRVYALEGPFEPDVVQYPSSAPPAIESAGGKACENEGCTREASLFCKNCSSALCEGCDKEIHCNAILKKHTRVDLAQRPVLCPDHHETMSLYCEQDNVLVCNDCIKLGSNHAGHATKHVDDVAAKERETMKKHLASLEREKQRIVANIEGIEKERRALATSCGTSREEIHALRDHMHLQVDRVIGRLLSDLAEAVRDRDLRLEQELGAMKALHASIEQGLGLAVHMTQSNSAGLVQQGVGRRLEEAARQALGQGGDRAETPSLLALDLGTVQAAADGLASLATHMPGFVRAAEVIADCCDCLGYLAHVPYDFNF